MDTSILNQIKTFFNNHKNIITVISGILVIAMFLYLVILNPTFGDYNKDEIHAWNIATDLSFFQIIKLMRAEGHTFLWYIMLKPFTGMPEIFFPWIIKYLNLFFVVLFAITIWIYAPVNKFFKLLVIFSYPMVSCFSLTGRCYGISLFLLGLIAILHKNRLNKPIIFSLLLLLIANTNLMAVIAIFGICVSYTIELFKAKNKKFILPTIIMALIPLSLFIQWNNPVLPPYSTKHDLYDMFNYHLFSQYNHIPVPVIPIIVISFAFITALIYFKNNTKITFYMVATFPVFVFFATRIYMMFDYHYLFMILVFFIFYWIYNTETENKDNKITAKLFYAGFTLLFIIMNPYLRADGYWFKEKYLYETALYCINQTIPENSIIYTSMFTIGSELPYLRNKYTIRTFNDDDFFTFDNYFHTYSAKNKYIRYDEKKLKAKNTGNKKKYMILNVDFIPEIYLTKPSDPQDIIKNIRKKGIKCEYLQIFDLNK